MLEAPFSIEPFMSRGVGSPVELASILPHESTVSSQDAACFATHTSRTPRAHSDNGPRLAAAPSLEHHSAIVALPPQVSFFGFEQSAARCPFSPQLWHVRFARLTNAPPGPPPSFTEFFYLGDLRLQR